LGPLVLNYIQVKLAFRSIKNCTHIPLWFFFFVTKTLIRWHMIINPDSGTRVNHLVDFRCWKKLLSNKAFLDKRAWHFITRYIWWHITFNISRNYSFEIVTGTQLILPAPKKFWTGLGRTHGLRKKQQFTSVNMRTDVSLPHPAVLEKKLQFPLSLKKIIFLLRIVNFLRVNMVTP